MIVTVTLNPATDLTYRLPGPLHPDRVHRVAEVSARAGGKGINVARVLTQLGVAAVATGPVDASFAAALAASGSPGDRVPADVLQVDGPVRRTLVVHDGEGATTSFWEPGSPVPPGTAERLVDHVTALVQDASVLVVSGSLRPGLGDDLPVRLAAPARERGLPVVLDLDDRPLRLAVEAGGCVVTPNGDELARLLPDVTDPVDAARRLTEVTGAPVVLTRGPEGLVLADADLVLTAAPPAPVRGNPTGAGDAVVAGLAAGLAAAEPWDQVLRRAVALGSAAVAAPLAGRVDRQTYDDVEPRVRIAPAHDTTRPR